MMNDGKAPPLFDAAAELSAPPRRSRNPYVAMIRGIRKRGPKEWSVYILRCTDGSFYTGIAKDVAARLKAHGRGRGAAYTRARRPVELLFREASLTRSQALVREWEIKQLPRPRKEKLIAAYRAALALSSAQTFS